MNRVLMTGMGIAFTLVCSSAGAALMTTAPAGGTTTVLTTVTGSWASAPSVVAGGFTMTAPNGSEVWYGDTTFGLADNGGWSNFAWAGGECNASACTATIDLGGLYGSVGGFMNYAPGTGTPVIAAIAADATTVLEWYDLSVDAPISTPGGSNDGAFRGVSRAADDIAYFRISGSYIILHDLTTADAGARIPEPTTLTLLGLGVAGLGLMRRRKA